MRCRVRLIMSLVGAAMLLLAVPQAAAASEARSVSPVFWISSFTEVPHAGSTLVRLDDDGIAFSFRTRELAPGLPSTLLLVIFNNPSGCSHGEGAFRCGAGDAVPGGPQQASVVPVAQKDIGRSGRLVVGGHLAANDASQALFGPGLPNPEGADVHLVVRQSGALVQASVHEAN